MTSGVGLRQHRTPQSRHESGAKARAPGVQVCAASPHAHARTHTHTHTHRCSHGPLGCQPQPPLSLSLSLTHTHTSGPSGCQSLHRMGAYDPLFSVTKVKSTYLKFLDCLNFGFFFLATPAACGRSPGQGRNPCHSSNPSPCRDNAGSLTCCATRELLPLHF